MATHSNENWQISDAIFLKNVYKNIQQKRRYIFLKIMPIRIISNSGSVGNILFKNICQLAFAFLKLTNYIVTRIDTGKQKYIWNIYFWVILNFLRWKLNWIILTLTKCLGQESVDSITLAQLEPINLQYWYLTNWHSCKTKCLKLLTC